MSDLPRYTKDMCRRNILGQIILDSAVVTDVLVGKFAHCLEEASMKNDDGLVEYLNTLAAEYGDGAEGDTMQEAANVITRLRDQLDAHEADRLKHLAALEDMASKLARMTEDRNDRKGRYEAMYHPVLACHRAHPHEEMDERCQQLTDLARTIFQQRATIAEKEVQFADLYTEAAGMSGEICRLNALLENFDATTAELEADKARLDWLAEFLRHEKELDFSYMPRPGLYGIFHHRQEVILSAEGKELREAIDQAIGQQEGGE